MAGLGLVLILLCQVSSCLDHMCATMLGWDGRFQFWLIQKAQSAYWWRGHGSSVQECREWKFLEKRSRPEYRPAWGLRVCERSEPGQTWEAWCSSLKQGAGMCLCQLTSWDPRPGILSTPSRTSKEAWIFNFFLNCEISSLKVDNSFKKCKDMKQTNQSKSNQEP